MEEKEKMKMEKSITGDPPRRTLAFFAGVIAYAVVVYLAGFLEACHSYWLVLLLGEREEEKRRGPRWRRREGERGRGEEAKEEREAVKEGEGKEARRLEKGEREDEQRERREEEGAASS